MLYSIDEEEGYDTGCVTHYMYDRHIDIFMLAAYSGDERRR